MQNPNIKALAGLVVLLTAALLVGNRLGFTWAGGEGYQPHGMLELVRQEGAFREYNLNNIRIFLDEKSEIELKDGRVGQEMIRFITGRIVIEGKLALTVRDTQVHVDGVSTLVNYSWLDILDVRKIDGTTVVRQGGIAESFAVDSEARLDTLAPFDQPTGTHIDLVPSAFYDWSLFHSKLGNGFVELYLSE